MQVNGPRSTWFSNRPTWYFGATFAVMSVTVAFGSVMSGCAKQSDVAAEATRSDQPERIQSAIAFDTPEEITASEAIIGQFLDRIRRGGDSQQATSLLTDRAQAELARIGQPIQPIGSPDASFQITRSEPAPTGDTSVAGESAAARLVHCIWSEPNPDAAFAADGTAVASPTLDYQVVWAVVRQPEGWRISGLVLETTPDEPPMVLDFENGEAMQQMFAGQSSSVSQTADAAGQQADSSQLR
ncbi:MAG: hypothetical protein AAF539_15170 [Planctomycetota bacterium]